MKKDDFLTAKAAVSKIEDLLSEAAALLESIAPEILPAIQNYHNETATLPYCLRWGLQAAKDLREDWHNVVSGFVFEGAGEEGAP